MIDVVVKIKRRQRQPNERWRRKMFGAEVLPKHLRPLDVIIAVKIAAADRASGKLQPPKNHADSDRAGDEISSAHGCLRFDQICQRVFRFDLSAVRRFLKLFHVVFEKKCEKKGQQINEGEERSTSSY